MQQRVDIIFSIMYNLYGHLDFSENSQLSYNIGDSQIYTFTNTAYHIISHIWERIIFCFVRRGTYKVYIEPHKAAL